MTPKSDNREVLLEELQSNTVAMDVDRAQYGYTIMNKSQLETFRQIAKGERREILGDTSVPCIYIQHQGNYVRRELEELDSLIAIGYTLYSSISDS